MNVIGPRIAETAAHFVKSGVVLEKDFQKFDSVIERGLRAGLHRCRSHHRCHRLYLFIHCIYINPSHISTWYRITTDNRDSLTWAGYWLVLICTPLYQFLILRWLWRLFLWFQLLARVRDLDLQLFPPHPDQAAGLGFVGEGQRFFGILLFAFSFGSTGVLAREIVYGGIPLKYFAPAIVGPLVVFTGTLIRTKRIGLHQYGTLATTYTGLLLVKILM